VYTLEANELDEEARKAISPIIKKWIKKGYNPKEIEYIINTATTLEACLQHMERNVSMSIEKRKQK
jgi:hypothetical protein